MDHWPELEVRLMRYPCDACYEGKSSEIISNLLQGRFKNILDSSFCNNVLSSLTLSQCFEDDLKAEILEKMKGFSENVQWYELLCIGISSLQLFVQINWTGPSEDNKYKKSRNGKAA